MRLPEVRIKTDFGEIVIPYSEISELEKGLSNIDQVIKTVSEKTGTIKIKDKPKVKPSFEDIYYINEDGTVSILKPGSKTENIGIILFAYDPTPLKVEFISHSSGVKKAQDFMKGKYFDRLDHGLYKLTSDGLSWIASKVIPNLRSNKPKGE